MTTSDADIAQQLQQGFDALNQGQLEVAASACQGVLAERPELAPAHFLVGLIAIEGDERRVAHEAFKSVVKIDRDHAAAWAQLARLNASEGRIARAESALREVRRIQPTDPAVLDLTGTVLNQLGEYPTAKAFFAQVNKQAPGKTGYMMNLANALVFNGDIDEAADLFTEVIRLDPRSAQSHWGLANAVKAQDEQHILQMRAWWSSTPTTRERGGSSITPSVKSARIFRTGRGPLRPFRPEPQRGDKPSSSTRQLKWPCSN